MAVVFLTFMLFGMERPSGWSSRLLNLTRFPSRLIKSRGIWHIAPEVGQVSS